MTVDFVTALLGASFLVIGFILAFQALSLVEHAREIPQMMHVALGVLSDPGLDDEAKEVAMQKQAIALFKCFVVLTAGGAVAVLAPVAAIWMGDYFGWISFKSTMDMTLDWRFIVGACVASLASIHFQQKPKATLEFENRYSGVDQLLHEIAFASRPALARLSNFEDRIFSGSLRNKSKAPVFITALPRAGTTLLLELCCEAQEFASHSYRHMPFVLTPLLWNRFAKRFRTSDVARERAHGDGMMVSLDSPEAFEEILWMQFWPDHYRADAIAPWDGKPHQAFDSFFQRHRDKIAALSNRAGSMSPKRYISKNNLNIARVERLAELISDSRVFIPFREPYQHAQSLLNQHLHFTKVHEQDSFSKTYMAGIGHFDFGANLKPVDFDNWLGTTPYKDPTTLPFWLAYWEASYGHLVKAASDRVRFSDFDKLCMDPHQALERIADYLCIENRQRFVAQAGRLRVPKAVRLPTSEIDAELRNRVDSVYASLKAVAI